MSGWIGVDFDGTLAHYEGWTAPHDLGSPIKPMVDRVKQWLAKGYEVRIFTARVSHTDEKINQECREEIKAWCKLHVGQELEVTNIKDYSMIELYDDRAVQVEMNTGKIVGHSTRDI